MPQKKIKKLPMKYRLLLILPFLTLMYGCVSIPDMEISLKDMYNVPSSGSSQFDGTKYIRMSNMVCNSVMFKLYQDTKKSEKGFVLLMAGSNSITNIGKGKSLLIKLDGKTYSFESGDVLTEHETIPIGYGVNMQFSHKSFVVPESFVREAAASKEFLTKVFLLNNSYIEGRCSPVTLLEAKEQNKELNKSLGLEITQKDVDTGNNLAATSGFRDFVKMMDSTSW